MILAVTAAWWALALVPVEAATTPEWLARTRLACFGAPPGGLPSAGGWVLLVGEPAGMLAVLLVVWRDNLRADLKGFASRPIGRLALGATVAALSWGALSAFTVVRRATAEPFDPAAGQARPPVRLDSVPRLVLTDQHGALFDLATHADRPVLVSFAYAHCADICPTLVQDLLRARSAAGRPDIPVVVVTVDPWRDVPARLGAIASSWGLGAGDRLLGGSVEAVTSALVDWGVGWSRNPDTGEVRHAPTAILVQPGGRDALRLDGDLEPLATLLGKS